MTNQEFVKLLKAHKGEIWMGVLGKNDVPYLRVYKNSLISFLLEEPEAECDYILEEDYVHINH
jgi:hypothetical protein